MNETKCPMCGEHLTFSERQKITRHVCRDNRSSVSDDIYSTVSTYSQPATYSYDTSSSCNSSSSSSDSCGGGE